MRVVLPFRLVGQKLVKGKDFPKSVADGSKDSVVIKVGGIPDGCIAKGYFKLSWENNSTYDLTFDGDELIVDEYIVTLPSHANNKYIDYKFSVSVAIWEGDVERLTTNPVEIVVEKSNYSDTTTNTPDIPESQFDTLAQSVAVVADLANSINEDVADHGSRIKALEDGGGNITVDDKLIEGSTNPVQNKVVTAKFNEMVEWHTGMANVVNSHHENIGRALNASTNAQLMAEDAKTNANQALITANNIGSGLSSAIQRVTNLESKGVLVVTFEGSNRDTASHTSADIYSHIANGGTAVFFDGNHYSNLTMCEPNEAVFCQVWDDNTIYRYVVDSSAGFEEQEIYIPQNGTGGGGGGSVEYNRINVRDYGAVGDGVADDRQAIIDAFEAAKAMLPCEVYFPAGTYGISNGITVDMAYGTGGLLVRGAGRDITTIKYLDSYDPDQKDNMWYAIRIWPVGSPNTSPTNEDDYLHDISFTGLTVYDPDPCAHAIHPDKGDSGKEETHGIDLQYCHRASVTECQFITVGDEAIDIYSCHDVVVMNNHIVGSPAAGSAGGAISIGDGSVGVVVSNNTVNGSAPDETLENGTVIAKTNFGIAVESLYIPVRDVVIANNVIHNIHGNGINFAATNAGASITNLVIDDNVIVGCDKGVRGSGSYDRECVRIDNNVITDCSGEAVHIDGNITKDGVTYGAKDIVVAGNTIREIKGENALYIYCPSAERLIISDNHLKNLHHSALSVCGQAVVSNCVFDRVGITDTARTSRTCAISKYAGTLTVSGCVLKNILVYSSVTNDGGVSGGIEHADNIEHTDIELVLKGVANGGGEAIKGSATKRVIGGQIGGRITISQPNAIVQGVTIVSSNIGNDALVINGKGVAVTGCVINTNNYYAISEGANADYNMIANNICKRPIKDKVGANTVIVNNITGAVTA